MRSKRLLLSVPLSLGLSWAMGCGVDGSLTFIPDESFNAANKAGAAGSTGGGSGAGAAGQAGAAAGQGGAAAGTGGAGGKAAFDPKCVVCLSNQCSVLFGQCASDSTCVDCVLSPANPECATLPIAQSLRTCACKDCEKQCGLQKCGAGMAGMGGAAGMGGGGAGQAGVGGAPGGSGGAPGGSGGAPGGSGGAAGGAGGGSMCGDGKLDMGEDCDGSLPPGQKSCAEYLGDPLAKGNIFCTGACVIDANDCHSCGDGTATPDEECDSTDLKGKTCGSFGKPQGTLQCSPTCKFDFSLCNGVAPACGDGVLQPDTEDCEAGDVGAETCATVLGDVYDGTLSCAGCRFDTSGCHRRSGMREGPPMATVPKPAGAAQMSVDTTEVTVAQYAYFLAHVPGGFGLPPFCSYQGTSTADFAPDAACDKSVPLDGAGPGARNRRPVVCVDFCDALAFCQWAGKSLCGGVSNMPPNAPWDKLFDSNVNAWTAACTTNGAHGYPYGDPYEVGTCNDDGIGLQEVGTRAGCHGTAPGYEGLRDMSGNVAEWSDACQGGMGGSDLCSVRGGSYGSGADALKCTASAFEVRAARLPTVGFRCCEVTGNPPPP